MWKMQGFFTMESVFGKKYSEVWEQREKIP